MSAPKIIVQVLVTGAQIFGKAFLAAGRQAVKNAKHSPQAALGADVAGVRNANTGSLTDRLTREHRMTLDEAQLILNVKRSEEMEGVIKNYEHLFKVNSPKPTPKAESTGPKARQPAPPAYSHYLQSKVFRARERIEAEMRATVEEAAGPASKGGPSETGTAGSGTGPSSGSSS
ncbi:protein transporter [Coniophora puteana RWD-64-598 SS2]|uniref:Mitochondrial import inner membrane translocase subunit TIM16 n=1 Tax=Coniophora puteana (strain RWD-64-598) TaxID=741705 RepID=A0A5M3MVL0_CONPW|nr:protein transporter [Coniophora puteana RWD-64-598 SS2]EIW83173.1 protein transporter [Coniophora puteana RWD-64-598 SS2]